LKNNPLKPSKNLHLHFPEYGHLWYNIARRRGMKNADNKEQRLQPSQQVSKTYGPNLLKNGRVRKING
jgi:hypothetical protein